MYKFHLRIKYISFLLHSDQLIVILPYQIDSFPENQPWSRNPIPLTIPRTGDTPPTPMKLNSIQSFKIDYEKHKYCKLVDKSKKRVEKYYVKKIKEEKNDWYFIASLNKELKEENRREWLLGHSNCRNGVIEEVNVSGRAENVLDRLMARRCGIGTILTALCIIDKDANPGDGIALDLNHHFSGNGLSEAQVTEQINQVKKECKKVVALEMSAEPGGGNIYFLAASMAGYNQMILFDSVEKRQWIWPGVEEAQKCYNENKLGCDFKYWFFCKEKEDDNSAPGNPTCMRKLIPKCVKPKF